MNTVASVVQVWLPLLIWQQVDAPRYTKGFITMACISTALIGTTFVVRHLHKREKALKARQTE
jgi:ACS family pantothenate transporter-like MFS transporter